MSCRWSFQTGRELLLDGDGNCEAEPSSAGVRGVDPDAAAVVLDDLLAQRQTDARPAVRLAAVQPLKDHEHLVDELIADADAVVRHREQPRALRLVGTVRVFHDDAWRGIGAAEFNGIAN